MNEFSGFLCLGSVLLVPISCLVIGYLVGANRLPFRIHIERNKRTRFAVEDDHDRADWK